jgi:hypothetical protein
MDNGRSTAPRRIALFLRRHSGVLAILLVALAYAQPIQVRGWNQASHYALVRALSHGHTNIDPYKFSTGDKAKDKGHWYSSRAPGLAFYLLPAYEAMRVVGIDKVTHKNVAGKKNDEMIWALGLWGNVIPAALMLLLVRWFADRIEPGYGTAAAVTLGLGTLILPFATLLFSHVLSALLGFAAFALLWRERERGLPPPRVLYSALAGLLVGYGFTTEYPLFIVGAVLGVYILATFPRDRAKHALAYVGGGILGIVPLLLYDKAAFGSFFHVAYADLPKHHRGFFGINVPNPKVAAELLFSSRGLLTLAPVLALSVLGIWWMYRRGRRAEAWVIGSTGLLFLIYNSGYYLPYGGQVPGPRFLITALPFLAVPLAVAYRRLPGPTLALAAVSTVCLAVPTLVKPFVSAEGDTGYWMHHLENHNFQVQILTLFGPLGWVSLIPFGVLVIGAVTLAALATPRLDITWRTVRAGLAAVAVWAPLAIFVPRELGIDHQAELRIVAAGDPTAVHEKFGSHPISHLVFLASGVAIVFMLVAWLLSWWTGRGRRRPVGEWSPAVGPPAREPTAAPT